MQPQLTDWDTHMTSNAQENQPGPRPPGHHQINIQIDRIHYRVSEDSLTGRQLRDLVTPPIPLDRDLFQVVPGGEDQKIELTMSVPLHDGMRFFTAPAHINPGRWRHTHGADQ